MGYIGNEPTTGHFPVDNFTSSGGSTYTLSKAPATAGAIEVSVQGVMQSTTAYTVSGTTLTMAGVTSGVKIFVRHLGETLSLPTPADGSVTTTKLGTNSVDGTKIAMGSDARGDILYHGATDYARLAKGTSGQVLTMGANDPAWADAAGGAWAVKTSGTFSAVSQVTFSAFTKTTKIIIPNVVTSAATNLKGRVGTGAGPTIITASHYSTDSNQFTNGYSASQNMTANHIDLLSNVNAVAAEPGALEIDLFVPESTAFYTNGRWISSAANAQHNIRTIIGAFRYGYQDTATTAVTAFQVFPASGTITGSYIVLELN